MALKFENLSVLVVEDTPPMRKLMMAVLEALGVGTIYYAEDGESGFDSFCRNRPDIVLTDWLMEPVNGIELVKTIRQSKHSPNRMVPVILISGYSAYARVAEARDAGVTEFMVKPFTANDLARRLAYVVNKPRDFVDHENFFGPDRRRKVDKNYKGPFRRESDKVENSARQAR